MRILLISPLPPPSGGIASWTEKYLYWVQKNQVNVDIVNTAVVGERAKLIKSRRRLSDEIARTVGILKDLKQKIKVYEPDIVHLNSPCGKFGIVRDYLCALLISTKGIPLVVHYRCNVSDQINSKIGLFFFKKLTSLGDLVLVLNAASREFVKTTTEKESRLVANFINEGFIIKRPKPISDKINKILFVGHVQAEKGSKEIIAVAHAFPEINFILAGPISDEILTLKIPDNVKMIGPVTQDEVRTLLDDADVFLFPSYSEGFANALLEAMARGVPIITTPVGANADMIEKSGGLLVGVGSVAEIVSSIKMISSSMVRENMSLWNVKKVETSYFVDNVMQHILGSYREVVDHRNEPS